MLDDADLGFHRARVRRTPPRLSQVPADPLARTDRYLDRQTDLQPPDRAFPRLRPAPPGALFRELPETETR